MPKKVQKKTGKAATGAPTKNSVKPVADQKKRPIQREEVLKDEDDEEKIVGTKAPNDDEVSPDTLEAALDTEDSYEADMDAEKDWE